MKAYGLTQKQVNEARRRFSDGEITFEEAMWWLGCQYNDRFMSYIEDDANKEVVSE